MALKLGSFCFKEMNITSSMPAFFSQLSHRPARTLSLYQLSSKPFQQGYHTNNKSLSGCKCLSLINRKSVFKTRTITSSSNFLLSKQHAMDRLCQNNGISEKCVKTLQSNCGLASSNRFELKGLSVQVRDNITNCSFSYRNLHSSTELYKKYVTEYERHLIKQKQEKHERNRKQYRFKILTASLVALYLLVFAYRYCRHHKQWF